MDTIATKTSVLTHERPSAYLSEDSWCISLRGRLDFDSRTSKKLYRRSRSKRCADCNRGIAGFRMVVVAHRVKEANPLTAAKERLQNPRLIRLA